MTGRYLKMNIRLFRCNLFITKILGHAPFNVNLLSDINKERVSLDCVYSTSGAIYNIALSFLLSFIVIYFVPKFYDESSDVSMERIILVALVIGIGWILIIVLLINCLMQQTMVTINNQLIHINAQLNEKLTNYHSQNGKFYTIMIVIISILIYIAIGILEFFNIDDNSDKAIKENIYLLCCGFVLQWCLIQYACVLVYLKNIFYSINESLLLLLISNNPHEHKSGVRKIIVRTNSVIEDLCIIRNSHRALYKATCNLSTCYSWSTAFAIIYFYGELIVTTYFFIGPFINVTFETPWIFSIINAVLWILKDFYPILVLANCGEQLFIEVCMVINFVLTISYKLYF